MRKMITLGLLSLILALPIFSQEAPKESPFDKDIQILQLILERNSYQTQLAQTRLNELIQKREEWLKSKEIKPGEKK